MCSWLAKSPKVVNRRSRGQDPSCMCSWLHGAAVPGSRDRANGNYSQAWIRGRCVLGITSSRKATRDSYEQRQLRIRSLAGREERAKQEGRPQQYREVMPRSKQFMGAPTCYTLSETIHPLWKSVGINHHSYATVRMYTSVKYEHRDSHHTELCQRENTRTDQGTGPARRISVPKGTGLT